jgi:hypothetical protein
MASLAVFAFAIALAAILAIEIILLTANRSSVYDRTLVSHATDLARLTSWIVKFIITHVRVRSKHAAHRWLLGASRAGFKTHSKKRSPRPR